MNNFFKLSAVAATIAASGMAYADPAETKGGIKIKTDDGRFEASIGGRIHFDGNLVRDDSIALFGSGALGQSAQSGVYFRRIYLTLAGKLYGWSYKIENDFAPNNATGATNNGFQDIWVGTDLWVGEIQIGQRKPFRAMEDLTSSNDVLMIERPFASSSGGLFAGGAGGSSREFQDGLFYHGNGDNYTWGVSATSLRSATGPGTEGWGSSARGTFTPINEEGSIIHLGVNVSHENPQNNQGAAAPALPNTPIAVGAGGFQYGGRRAATANLGATNNKLTTWGIEYANVFGPFFLQAEYYNQLQLQDQSLFTPGTGTRTTAAPENQTIQAYYVQASYFVTGESKPYKKKDGTFGNPKPNDPNGAVEVTFRYDNAQNKDNPTACSSSAPNGVAVAVAAPLPGNPPAGAAIGRDTCKVQDLTFGVNYYFNPNVRFMLNYVIGNFDLGTGPIVGGVATVGKDKPRTVAARFQLSF